MASSQAATHLYTLDELVRLTKSQNYDVQLEAEKVFQARKRIRIAVANLLPHLRTGSVIGLAFTGNSTPLDLVGELLPFLFPSNWFKASAARRLYEAEAMSYASLRANEVFEVESLYYAFSRDREINELLKRHLKWLNRVHHRLHEEELAGTIASGTADYFRLCILKMEDDRAALQELLEAEKQSMLLIIAADPSDQMVEFVPVAFHSIEALPEVHAEQFLKTTLDASYEIKALDWMIDASYYLKRAVIFGYLDPSSDQSIGFGMAAPVAIARSQTHELELLQESTTNTIKQKVMETAFLYNESIHRSKLASKEIATSSRELSRLFSRHSNGDPLLEPVAFIDSLTNLQNELLAFEIARLNQMQRNYVARARIQRLTLKGFYSGLDEEEEQLP